MKETTAELLERYESFIEDQVLFYCLFDYLPTCYQYQFIVNLISYEDLLIPGDVVEGTAQEGSIKIDNHCIVLEDSQGDIYVLCALPQTFDIVTQHEMMQ